MGLNSAGKPVWLEITGFNPVGARNYRLKAIEKISDGYAQYKEIWVGKDEINLKHFEEGQLKLDILSRSEEEELKYSPRYFNQRRFEVITPNEKQFIYANNIEMAHKVAAQYGIKAEKIRQVPRLRKKEVDD